MKLRYNHILFAGIIVLVAILGFVFAAAPNWNPGAANVNYTTSEDSVYYHNFSANITGFYNDVTFAINTVQNNISWRNSSGTYIYTSASVISPWISITNSQNGNLTINATYDNQTGFFVIPVQATNTSGGEGTIEIFEFVINASNDAPNFTNINSTYNFSALNPLFEFLNASDEDSHYPLNFTVTFNSTYCTHASWSGYPDNTNCSLQSLGLNFSNLGNLSALLNFTPTTNHVGVYYANISVRDSAGLYTCSASPYCAADYSQNKTTYYSSIVAFNIFA